MKFNEKLIELRRKEGLSQEELGYKLNVTRQTISKWELGQTTPEMDKLAEISKIFNISVDDLMNESKMKTDTNPIIEDQQIRKENPTREKNVKIIIIGVFIIVIILIAIKLFSGIFAMNKVNDIINGVTGSQEENVVSIFDRFFGLFDELFGQTNATHFNMFLETRSGTQSGSTAKSFLDDIVTSNNTQDKKIIVKFNDIETQDVEQIRNLKKEMKDSNNYEISYEYDEEGYINKVTLERVITENEVKRFNNSFEVLYSGSKMGGHVIGLLDEIITSNKTEDRMITVKYAGTETQNETEIKNIKKKIGTFNDYDVTFEYDADGFINKAIIENF